MSAANAHEIFMSVIDDEGNICVGPNDYETRAGVSQEPISDSVQQCIKINHLYINGTTWYLKML